MLQSLLDLLQQIDLSALGDLSELDWTNIATYGALTAAFAGIIWTASKNFLKLLWQKTEGLIGFIVSTLVVISLWYTLLRVHVSISFNLDKEVFDNLLWFSAILFTPYYLIHYKLLTGFLLTIVRSVELVFDLLIFSWFPQKAEQNRTKWKTRIGSLSQAWKETVSTLFNKDPMLVPTAAMASGGDEATAEDLEGPATT
ncbi:hypothetical protein [Leptothoe kymatousa]|uniref:Uncharacterized protein n=1 Tax=Leptothoe kymatousa TAU-MAC 1615 TaxID=2364775 RepID=A0ABS5Y2I0_9CYAN|nr:hypothetical protein [Leptothoe kymatousa]MBT9312037.1 hypothetical protein [Leptothoe kymatousa TAU-MAC 1615]